MRQNISSSRWTRIVHTLYTQPKPKATYIKIWFRIYSEDFVPLKYSEYHQKLKEVTIYSGIPLWLGGRESTCCCRRHRFHPWVRMVPWRRAWQPTAVFLPENPMDRGVWQATVLGVTKESNTTWRLNSHHHIFLGYYKKDDCYQCYRFFNPRLKVQVLF